MGWFAFSFSKGGSFDRRVMACALFMRSNAKLICAFCGSPSLPLLYSGENIVLSRICIYMSQEAKHPTHIS